MRPTDRPPLHRVPGITLGIALLVGVALTGCTGDEPDEKVDPWPPQPPLIEAAWSVAPLPGNQRTVVDATTSVAVLVANFDGGLVALDPATGATLWTEPATTQVCTTSDVTAAGMVALAVSSGGHGRCRTLVVYDVATGERAWSAKITESSTYGQLAISDDTVTYHERCSGLRRWDLATGSPKPRLPLGDLCEGLGISAGVVVGTTVVDDEVRSVGLYDPDTGRRLARVRGYDSPRLDIAAVVSADPLIIDANQRGHRLLRVIGADGLAGIYLGDQLDTNPTGHWRTVGIGDGVLVGTFSRGSRGYPMFGIDLTTGERLWTLGVEDAIEVLGLQGGGLLSAHRVGGDYWLERADLRDIEQSEVLGRVDGRGDENNMAYGVSPALAGDRVLVIGTRATAAYDVPARGDGESYERPSSGPEAGTGSDAWVEGDLRPEDLAVDCRGVSPQAFRILGWGPDADLPPSSSCSWSHRYEAGELRSAHVDVTAFASGPGPSIQGSTLSAVEAAQLDTVAVTDGERRVALPGLGDEAWLQRPRLFKIRAADQETVVTVRVHNLVVQVSVDLAAGRRATAAGTRSLTDRAVLELLGQLLEPYDLDLPDRLPTRVT